MNDPFFVKSAMGGKGVVSGPLASATGLGPPSLLLSLTLASVAPGCGLAASGAVLPASSPGAGLPGMLPGMLPGIVASLTLGLAGPASGPLAPASSPAPGPALRASRGSSPQAASHDAGLFGGRRRQLEADNDELASANIRLTTDVATLRAVVEQLKAENARLLGLDRDQVEAEASRLRGDVEELRRQIGESQKAAHAVDQQAATEKSPLAEYDLRESLTIAFLLALEALTPTQRAVLLLRDVFEYSTAETAEAVVSGAALTIDVALSLVFTEQVTVGSRASAAESARAVPVDIITRDQIAASGYAETAQVIQSLTPSFNFPRPSITDGTDTVRPATLRGLGPDQVLVLVNGKRRHQSSLVHLNNSVGRGSTGVDLNAIPVSAIDHIEVLRDGASAQYGSDAIAGVINIVLKSGASAPALTSKFGLSKGTFAGNNCTPNGLTCAEGAG